VNASELKAYGLVAQAIASHAFAKANADPAVAGSIYFHDFMSAFEDAAHDLVRLGVLKPLDQKPGCAYFVFNCEIDEASRMAERNWQIGPKFPELLVTFVNLFGEFGREYWGFSSKPNVTFGAGGRITKALDALASLGYLKKKDGGYVWTDRIVPVMLQSYEAEFWSSP